MCVCVCASQARDNLYVCAHTHSCVHVRAAHKGARDHHDLLCTNTHTHTHTHTTFEPSYRVPVMCREMMRELPADWTLDVSQILFNSQDNFALPVIRPSKFLEIRTFGSSKLFQKFVLVGVS